MGCNWVALRNLYIVLGGLVTFATSSAIFAIFWQRTAPEGPWKAATTSISLSAASMWSFTALGVATLLKVALGTFCSCAGRIPACAMLCEPLNTSLIALIVALISLGFLCLTASFDLTSFWTATIAIAMSAAIGTSTVMLYVVGSYVLRIIACQG